MAWGGHAPRLLPEKPAKARTGADIGAPEPSPSLAQVTCALQLSHGGCPTSCTSKEVFFLSPSRPGEVAGSQVLGTKRHCFGSPVLSKSSPNPSHTSSTHRKQQHSAGGVSWGWRVPGDQHSPTSAKQERGCKICAWSGPGHEFWWVISPLFPGSSGPRECDPTVGLRPCLLQPTLLLLPALLGTVLAPCPPRELEPGDHHAAPHCAFEMSTAPQ